MLKYLLTVIFVIIVFPVNGQNINKNTYYSVQKDTVLNFKDINVIKYYQKYITPIDGNRCVMYPSCSEYSHQAIEKFGFIRGYIMTTERLTRCSKDLKFYNSFIKNNIEYNIDPVENFIWNGKEKH